MSDQSEKPRGAANPHDTRLKELFSNKEAFISLLKDCLKADWFGDLDTDSLKKSETTFILQDFRKKEADVVYEATINNGSQRVIFYLLLELQSSVDYRMPYRLMLYTTEVLRHYYNNSNPKARTRKGFKFPVVVPMVFFSGKRRWTASTNLREMFDGYKRFGGSLLNFEYALIDAKGYDKDSVKDFRSRLLKIMMMFEKSKNVSELIEVIRSYKSDIEQLDEEEYRILNVAIGILSNLFGVDINEIAIDTTLPREARVSGMLANLIDYEKKRIQMVKKESRAEGKAEGIAEGKAEGKAEGIAWTQMEIAKKAFADNKLGASESDIVDLLKSFGIPDDIIDAAQKNQ